MPKQQVLVVSIDGVAPRFVTPDSMPYLCALARQGASCFSATTVHPSITLPAHTSLLRGIDPAVHGIYNNTPLPLGDDWPTFLRVARQSGLRTTAMLNWSPVNHIVEDDALDVRYFLNGGYGLDDDDRLVSAAKPVLAEKPDIAFAYLVSPDLAGHDHGWGSPTYVEALGRADRALGVLLRGAGDDVAVIVTTDHGGEGNDHQQSRPLDMETFVVVRATGVEPMSTWTKASILDVAPTVAELAGFDPESVWSGSSLVGREHPIVELLLGQVAAMADHAYGERVNMLEHSLQTAAAAHRGGADEALIAASLLHDVGHIHGDAGRWGLADHACVGASALQQVLPTSVVEPIRLHVAAKRYLVATDPSYQAQLSEASVQSLVEQGGPFTAAEAEEFERKPFADQAVELRRYDDAGKMVGQDVPRLSSYRGLLERQLAAGQPSAQWLRDACACRECRDPTSGQHLVDVSDAAGWTVLGHDRIGDESGVVHAVERVVMQPDDLPTTYWDGTRQVSVAHDLDQVVLELSEFGLSLAAGLESRPGAVLEFASRLGFVRETNYGQLFDVRAVGDANNLAYTTLGLPLHTDNPYRDPVPTVQLLHCLQPADEGGASRFCDGFAVAEALRSSDPAHFDILTTTPVDYRFHDRAVDLRARHAMIELAVDGALRSIHVNHRSMVTPAPGPWTDEFNDAYRHFAELLNSSAYVVNLTLAAGEVVAFDNRRVLHSRTGFSTQTERHLQGCYMDIDAVHSAARRIRSSRTVDP